MYAFTLYLIVLLTKPFFAIQGIDEILESCFIVPKRICFKSGDKYKIIGKHSSEIGLLAWWSFDESILVDRSGHKNHLNQQFSHGPPVFGHGYSLEIGSSFQPLNISLNNSNTIKNFTVTFWFYPITNNSLYFSNLISKGNYNSQTFTILLYPDNRLSIRISTETDVSEGIASNSRLLKERWSFIAIAASNDRLEIYVNGILDNFLLLSSPPVSNDEQLIIGPFNSLSYKGYLDELKIYNHKLPSHYIASMTNTALTGFTTNLTAIVGCHKCTFNEAKRFGFCPENFSLCSSKQMYIYAAHIARVNGWLEGNDQIWHLDTIPINKSEKRLGLCCIRDNL